MKQKCEKINDSTVKKNIRKRKREGRMKGKQSRRIKRKNETGKVIERKKHDG